MSHDALSPTRTRLAAIGALGLTTALFLLMLVDTWRAARTHGAAIGGLLPYSDAGDYLGGAQRLLREGSLDEWNSRRPLNAALLAARLALSGGDLRLALVLQAVLLGVSTWCAARALQRDHGLVAGALLTVAMLIFGGIYVGTTMSESLGLSLGALALSLLWESAHKPSNSRMFLSFLAMSAALSARSGPLFALPMLVVWCWASFRDRRLLGASLAGALSGAALNALLLLVHRGVGAGAQSNFAFTLYGLSVGGRGYEVSWVDHPEITGLPDSEAAARIYAFALANLRSHPWTFARGLFTGLECMVLNWTEMFSGDLLAHHPRLQWAAFLTGLAGLCLAVRWLFARLDPAPTVSMLCAVTLGMFLSVPVIYVDGRERVFAATFPCGIALLAVLLASLRRAPRPPGAPSEGARTDFRLPAFLTLALLASALALPRIAHALRAPTAPVALALCPPGTLALRFELADATPRIDLTSSRHAPLSRSLAVSTFRANIYRDPNLGTNLLAGSLTQLAPGTSLLVAMESEHLTLQYLSLPTASLHHLPRTVSLCARALSADARHIVVGTEAL